MPIPTNPPLASLPFGHPTGAGSSRADTTGNACVPVRLPSEVMPPPPHAATASSDDANTARDEIAMSASLGARCDRVNLEHVTRDAPGDDCRSMPRGRGYGVGLALENPRKRFRS